MTEQPKIDRISFYSDDNTAWFDNCDGAIDYFPSFSGTLKYITERVKEYGGNKIVIEHQGEAKFIRSRASRIAKTCGYIIQDNSREVLLNGVGEHGEPVKIKTTHQEFVLIKNNS